MDQCDHLCLEEFITVSYDTEPASGLGCKTLSFGNVVQYQAQQWLMLSSLTEDSVTSAENWLGPETAEMRVFTAFYTPEIEIGTFLEVVFTQVLNTHI